MSEVTRREFVGTVASMGVAATGAAADRVSPRADRVRFSLTINGRRHEFDVEPRVTLLDLLRERLHLTGPKKGCDHGQCGACTVLVDGARINACLSLAVMQDGRHITTIEGLATGEELHPMQAAFLEHDGFQCGFCTAGQICSAVAMLREARAGMPSAVSAPGADWNAALSAGEIRERMAGNICRCGAYPNIVAAIQAVHQHVESAENRS